jgi:hypothetical protein
MLARSRDRSAVRWEGTAIVVVRDHAFLDEGGQLRPRLPFLARFFAALHRSREREAARAIHRYQFLIDQVRAYDAGRDVLARISPLASRRGDRTEEKHRVSTI